jgi:hypothetical protein
MGRMFHVRQVTTLFPASTLKQIFEYNIIGINSMIIVVKLHIEI